MKKGRFEFLTSPWLALAAAVVGLGLGLGFPDLARQSGFIGELFVDLLALSALPIIICAIITSVAEALRSEAVIPYIGRTLLVFLAGALLTGAVGVFLALLVLKLFSPSPDVLATLGSVLKAQTVPTFDSGQETRLLKLAVPSNIFATFSSGSLPGIVVVSLLVGMGVGFLPAERGRTLLALCSDIYEAFMKVLGWSIYFTPFGFASLIASAVAALGGPVLLSLVPLLALQYLAMICLCLLYLAAVWTATGVSWRATLRRLRPSITVAILTMDPIPAMPLAMKEMDEEFGQPGKVGNFVIPITVVLNGHNLTVQLAIMAVFVAHIFGIALTFKSCVGIVLLSALPGSLAGPSMPTLLAIVPHVLGPLGLPADPGMALILVTGPLLAPLCGVHTLLSAVANSAIVSRTRAPG